MIATTLEQSKRLVEAGVNAEETADFYYDSTGILEWRGEPILFMIGTFQVPAWSLSALWDLCKDYPLQFATCDESAEDVIACLVEHLIKNKK